VQHIAFEVEDRDTLLQSKQHLQSYGIPVVGVTNHGIFHSIYFFDPNGHRIELTYRDPQERQQMQMLNDVKWLMLEEWSQTKRAPRHAAFLHNES